MNIVDALGIPEFLIFIQPVCLPLIIIVLVLILGVFIAGVSDAIRKPSGRHSSWSGPR